MIADYMTGCDIIPAVLANTPAYLIGHMNKWCLKSYRMEQ